MPWIADLHIHSHFSMATSKACTPVELNKWAGLKGVSLVGTGDFTHPGWRRELRETLAPAESGFYRLAEPAPNHAGFLVPDRPETRFVVSGEISTIYKKNGRTRKVHHLIVLPSIEYADLISARLEEMGMNIRSDGRPILGLDSRLLLELVLEKCPEAIFIPAHIWTPHFSVFGSNSGFDTIEECYEDLTPHIFALETGLSSDPAMNWRWSALDCFALVSNSDAHNPQNLAREANIFTGEFSYFGMKEALQKKNGNFGGTLEFFPEEGKYHYDGHRNCAICWKPSETIAADGICPVCGRKVTVGVLHRVWELADRPEGFRSKTALFFQNLVPLKEIIASAVGSTSASRKVEQFYLELLRKLGPELTILRNQPVADIAKAANPLVAEAVKRLREGNVAIKPGYDGAYGVIAMLRQDDRQALLGQASVLEQTSLLEQGTMLQQGPLLQQGNLAEQAAVPENSLLPPDRLPGAQCFPAERILRAPAEPLFPTERGLESAAKKPGKKAGIKDKSHFAITPEQQAVVRSESPVTMVSAGPGTGKTRTLVERICYLIREKGVPPGEITAVTFTNKAAAEIRTRLNHLLGDKVARQLAIGTFHGLAWRILNHNPEAPVLQLLDELQSREIIAEVLRQKQIQMTTREAALTITVFKNQYPPEADSLPPRTAELITGYQSSLRSYGRCDFDDILHSALQLWDDNPDWLQPFLEQFRHLLIDEFQDLNAVQYELTKRWCKGNQSLLVIGDPNQAIYGFRGGSQRFFECLQRDYPETALFRLTHNHRSAASLVDVANQLVTESDRQHSSEPPPDDLSSAVYCCVAPTEKAAAKALVAEIIELIGGSTMISAHGGRNRNPLAAQSFSFNDIAVLYRTGRQVESLEDALENAGLPYRVTGQEPTREAMAVKEFLTFFRYLRNRSDIFNLRSMLAIAAWGLNKEEIARLGEKIKQSSHDVTGDRLAELGKVLRVNPDPRLKEEAFLSKFDRIAETVAHYSGFLEFPLAQVIGEWKMRMNPEEPVILERLLKLGENHPTIGAFLDFLPLATEADLIRKGNRTTGSEAITLSTIHAAKGLEFGAVFIYGVEEGLLPLGNHPDPTMAAEEQRLFYVGLTRAEQGLYLVNIQNRFRNAQWVPTEPSRYLKLLPQQRITKLNWERFAEKSKQLDLF